MNLGLITRRVPAPKEADNYYAEQHDSGEEESVKCSLIVPEVRPRKIIHRMKCVISDTHAVIMVIAFTLRRCHDYLADITQRSGYSRTARYVETRRQSY